MVRPRWATRALGNRRELPGGLLRLALGAFGLLVSGVLVGYEPATVLPRTGIAGRRIGRGGRGGRRRGGARGCTENRGSDCTASHRSGHEKRDHAAPFEVHR